VINLYGIFISLGIFLSIFFIQKLIEKKDEETLWGVSFWTILSGIAGARIYHVIDRFDYYVTNPVEILKIWNGGMGIWGAMFGGLLGAFIYLKIKKQRILPWLDVISVGVPLGQAVGRWGNFFNNEIFGKPTTLPWGMYVNPENRPEQFLNYQKFHPLFIYESILNLILFVLLFKLYKKFHEKIPEGIFMSLYLGGYSIIRFFLENLRINPWNITLSSGATLNVSQTISILVLTFSIVFIRLKVKNDIHFFRS